MTNASSFAGCAPLLSTIQCTNYICDSKNPQISQVEGFTQRTMFHTNTTTENRAWSAIPLMQVAHDRDDSDLEQQQLDQTTDAASLPLLLETNGPNPLLQTHLTYALIASITVGALLGILAILFEFNSPIIDKILLTNGAMAVFSLCGMACTTAQSSLQKRNAILLLSENEDAMAAHTLKALFIVTNAGLVLSTATALLVIAATWNEGLVVELYWQVSGVAAILTVASVHICLLSIAILPRRYEFLFWIAFHIIIFIATALAINIFFPIIDHMGSSFSRLMGVLGVIDGAITSVIPMLHRVGVMEAGEAANLAENRDVAAIDREIVELQAQMDRLKRARNSIQGGLLQGQLVGQH
jgi:hypothetical protein